MVIEIMVVVILEDASRETECGQKGDSGMFIILYFLTWVSSFCELDEFVKWMSSFCKKSSSWTLMICALFCVYVIVE